VVLIKYPVVFPGRLRTAWDGACAEDAPHGFSGPEPGGAPARTALRSVWTSGQNTKDHPAQNPRTPVAVQDAASPAGGSGRHGACARVPERTGAF